MPTTEIASSAVRRSRAKAAEPQRNGKARGDRNARRGAVDRSFHLLEILVGAAGPMTITALAQLTRLEPNTVHRLLEQMAASGYVRKHASSKRYSASARAMFPLSLRHPLNALRQETREQLRVFSERFNETVCLLIFVGLECVIVDYIQGRETLSLYETRLTSPVHASAAGTLMLRDMSERERRELLGDGPFEPVTPFTATTHEALARQIAIVEESGYSLALQTAFVGINAIAAPIYSQHGLLGCVASTGGAHRFDPTRCAEIGEALKDLAVLVAHGAPSINSVAHFLGVDSAEGDLSVKSRRS